MNWKRSILAIASIAVLGAGVKLVMACADSGDPTDMYVSFFQNNITSKPQYQPFAYTDYTTFYGGWYDYTPNKEDEQMPDANIAEWYIFCSKTAKHNDIDSFMNKYTYKEAKAFFDKKSGVSSEIKNNSFCKFLAQPKNSEAMDYLLYAKKCEPLVSSVESYWDNTANEYKSHERDTAPLRTLILDGVAKNGKVKSEFLKWRYAYQALRLAFNNGDYKTTLKLYDKVIAKKTADNIMYPRCLALKAGALYRTGKKKEAAYLYSRVFDMSDDMKRSAFLSFTWATDKIKIADLVPLCKNDHEKAVLAVMDALYERSSESFEGLALLQYAYKLDPKVNGLDVIMTREINKAEQRYLQEKASKKTWNTSANYYVPDAAEQKKENAQWNATKSKYTAYLTKLNLFAQKMATDKKMKDKAFWYLASSYICFISDKYADCHKYMDLAGKEKMNTHEHDMHDVINMLCIVRKNDKITPETEAELLPSLKWVESREGKNARFGKVYRDFLFNVLAARYMDQKDTVKAVYALARVTRSADGGFYVADDYTDVSGNLLERMSYDRFHDMERFVQKSNKTEFETWLTDQTSYSADDLKELEGTKYMRDLNFEKAVAVLSTVSGDLLSETELPDMFISRLGDSQVWNESDSETTYNKLEFAKKMATLQQTLQTQPKNARIAYQYANALYNISYYGRGHRAVDYYRGSSDGAAYYASDARKNQPAWKKEYYSLVKAQKYYMIAVNHSSDPEMKARCLFLAAKCLQKNCDVPAGKTRYDFAYDDKTYYRNTVTNPYLEQLYAQYSTTKLYREVHSTCSYFRDFVKVVHHR